MKLILFTFAFATSLASGKPQFPIVLPETSNQINPTPEVPPPVASSSVRECYKGCPKVQQYNPVCGSDGITYINMQYVRCAQSCGTDVQVVRSGTCDPVFDKPKFNVTREGFITPAFV